MANYRVVVQGTFLMQDGRISKIKATTSSSEQYPPASVFSGIVKNEMFQQVGSFKELLSVEILSSTLKS